MFNKSEVRDELIVQLCIITFVNSRVHRVHLTPVLSGEYPSLNSYLVCLWFYSQTMSDSERRSRSRHRRSKKSRRSHNSSRNVDPYYNILKQRLDQLENRMHSSISASETAENRLPLAVPLPSTSRSYTPPTRELPNSSVLHELHTSRYVGRFELIPVFDGSTEGMTVDRWIDKINSVANLYNWDDRAKIFGMSARLAGHAKSWHECQTKTYTSWIEWEDELRAAFPVYKGIAAKLKDFVTIVRKPNQDLISFYYEKLRMGKHCSLL